MHSRSPGASSGTTLRDLEATKLLAEMPTPIQRRCLAVFWKYIDTAVAIVVAWGLILEMLVDVFVIAKVCI